MNTTKIVRLSMMAMLSAIAVVLVILYRTPLLAAAPYMEYDMADVPVLIATMMFGVLPGLSVLLLVSVIQAFLLGGNGWIGLVMHFIASGTLVLIVGLFRCKTVRGWKTVLGMVLGTLGMAAVMIPMNLILAPLFLGQTVKAVVAMLIPIIVPFNILKAGINCAITFILMTALSPIMKKTPQLFPGCKIK
ncbi:MAG: ECF transporter S component [Oscillospiraceae bacterium]|nr:ECF transporter S component [Oscillospiraceae bacterium]